MKNPSPPAPRVPFVLESLARERGKGRIQTVFGCYHCHHAREVQQQLALEEGNWAPDHYWIYPEPSRIGLELEQFEQNRVRRVIPDSPASAVGIRKGDVVERVGGARVLTKYDVQWVLHERRGKSVLPIRFRRGDQTVEAELPLKSEWEVGDPSDYAWRVRNVYTEHMAKFLPTPGFIGKRLTRLEHAACGIPGEQFALKISQLNFGSYHAGMRIGDIVLSADGRSNFTSVREFHAWCESLRRASRDIRMGILRQDAEMSVMVPLAALNEAKVEKAPEAVLGFILQQLSGGAGLRVGHVTDGCNAERAGIRVGDRISHIDGKEVSVREAVLSILNQKSPGDLLTMDLQREAENHQVSYVLSAVDSRESKVARLSEPVTRNGQELACLLTIDLPKGKHIYSMHRSGFGVPTHLVFRGRGFELLGETKEPLPRKIVQAQGLDPMWVIDGKVELSQRIRVTDLERFQLLVQVYAQVCDEVSCHEFRAVAASDGLGGDFTEYLGRFEKQPRIGLRGIDDE